MNKFEIGNKVKILHSEYKNSGLDVGTVHQVRAVFCGGVELADTKNGMLLYFNPSSVELVKDNTGTSNLTLPTDSNERKGYPFLRGCLRYFPAALSGVAKTSKLGNDKHNPGEEMHHARGKSMDHGDCIIRHLLDTEDLFAALKRGDKNVTDQDVLNEVNQMAWRALALSQLVHEHFGAPLAPGAKINSTAETGKGKTK